MAGSSVYPGALDNFSNNSPTNLGDNDSTGRTHSERHDDVEAAIEAVQSELGINPSGTFATVGERLDALAPGDIDELILSSQGTAIVPLTVIGAAGQSADLIQFKNSGGTAIATVSAAGAATFAGINSSGYTLNGTALFQSPALSGTPTAPTATANTNTTQIATTAFVLGQAGTATPSTNGTAAAGSSSRYSRDDHIHATDTTRAALASPTFTGTPAAPTAPVNTNSTQIATTAFVLAQAGTATPLVEGVGAVGTATRFAREDHVHPSGGGGGGGGIGLESVFLMMGA